MRWVKKTGVQLFRLSFSTGKALFRLCKKARFGLQSKKAVFD